MSDHLRPPAPSINPDVTAAMASFRKESTNASFTNVVRQLLQGELLLDATGSVLEGEQTVGDLPEGSGLRLGTFNTSDGKALLTVFTNADHARHARKDGQEPRLLKAPGVAILTMVSRGDFDGLVLDPEDGRLVLVAEAVSALVGSYSNARLKRALALRDDTRIATVLTALAETGRLFLATEKKNMDELEAGAGIPTRAVTRKDGRTFLAVFTAAIEVHAAFPGDAAIQLDVEKALARLSDSPALAGIVINIAGPSAELNREQLSHLL